MRQPTVLVRVIALALTVVGSTGAHAAGIDDPVRSLPGFDGIPGPIARSGDFLYVGMTGSAFPWAIKQVYVGDPGGEFISDDLFCAVNPVDLVMTPAGVLYAVDQFANFVDRRSPTGVWTSIPTPNGGGTYYGYGEKLYLNGGKMYLIHHEESMIDVLDPATGAVLDTITDLDGKPGRIRFTESHLVVLATTTASPNYSVFQLSDLSKVYRRDLARSQPQSLILRGAYGEPDGRVYVTSRWNQRIDRYDFTSGAFEDTLDIMGLGRCTAQNATGLILQQNQLGQPGSVLTMSDDLDTIIYEFDVIEESISWEPPYEEIHVMPAGDDRIFMTNRNDGTLTIIDPPCPADLDGSLDVGFADVVAILSAWGPCAGCPEDLDGDGMVGFTDLVIVLSSWGGCT